MRRVSLQNVSAHLTAYSKITSDSYIYGNETRIFSDSTFLRVATMENSVAILHNCSVTYLDSWDNSKMLVFNCTSTRLQALGSSNVTVNYSSLELIWATDSTIIKVLNSSKVAVLETAANSQVFVNGTQVGELTLNLPTAGFRTGLLNVSLVRSSVDQLNVYAESGYMSVQKIQPTNMAFANILGKDGSPSLILENTSVKNAIIKVYDTRIHVNDCHLNKLLLRGYSSALIENSTVDLLVASDDALAIISNSEVDETFTDDNAVVADTSSRLSSMLTRYEIYAVISTIALVIVLIVLGIVWASARKSFPEKKDTKSPSYG